MAGLGFLGKIINEDAAKAAFKAKGATALESVGKSLENFANGRISRATRATGRAAGRGITNVGSSRAGMAAVGIGALGLGVGSEVGPSLKGAALDAAFGDENADQYFTGRSLDSRFLVGSMMGGVGGGLLQASAPSDYLAANPIVPGPTAMLGATAVTGAVGGFTGGVIGSAIGGAIGGALSMGGVGKMVGGITGTLAGAGLGASVPTGIALGGHITRNQEFYKQSPYSSSSSTAAQLGASGDIVLGMHNSRRGY